VIDLCNVPDEHRIIESQRDPTQNDMALKQQKTALCPMKKLLVRIGGFHYSMGDGSAKTARDRDGFGEEWQLWLICV
jgi:hypothetical protein